MNLARIIGQLLEHQRSCLLRVEHLALDKSLHFALNAPGREILFCVDLLDLLPRQEAHARELFTRAVQAWQAVLRRARLLACDCLSWLKVACLNLLHRICLNQSNYYSLPSKALSK